jgi:hypothetical protein
MSELRPRDAAGKHRSAGRRASWFTRRRAAKLLSLSTSGKVRFGRIRALVWIAVGLVSFPLGWANSVVLVWIASFYANAESGFATAEGADNRALLKELDRHRKQLERIENLLTARTPATSD